MMLGNANYQMQLVIVVDSIGFQLPIAQLPISDVNRIVQSHVDQVVTGCGGQVGAFVGVASLVKHGEVHVLLWLIEDVCDGDLGASGCCQQRGVMP